MILSNHAEILQILEIPQFMNTCIRGESYEEALSLTSFVKRLVAQHGDIPLINVCELVSYFITNILPPRDHLTKNIFNF